MSNKCHNNHDIDNNIVCVRVCVCKFLVFSLEMKQTASNYTIESILSSIHCYRCHNHIELIAIVNILSDFIKQHNQVITFFKLTYCIVQLLTGKY